MPKLYENIRDECIERKRKKKGKVSEEDIKNCKKMAAITYFKIKKKPVQHAESREFMMDDIDLDIMIEQLDIFGSLENYEDFNK